MQQDSPRYDYSAAGFNAFLERSIDSAGGGDSNAPSQALAFDRRQISGSFGDSVQIGAIRIDGVTGRISVSTPAGTITLGQGDNGALGMSVADDQGVRFSLDAATWSWFDRSSGQNDMALGELPSGDHGFVITKKGRSVRDVFG